MNRINWILAMSLFAFGLFTSCNDDEETIATNNLTLNLDRLEDLGSAYAYEGWIIVDGSPVSTGVFTVNTDRILSVTSFEVDAADLDAATAFVLTIEPSPDSDPAPSSVHILGGDMNNGTADLTVSHGDAIGNDFTSSTGGYILATPTDGEDTNEKSGVWWINPAAGPGAGLDLPTLPNGWAYEGWVVIDGTPVSTGTFTSVSGADNSASYSGTAGGPPFPGEDLLNAAPDGLNFPIDLSGRTVVISVEPVPDNSAAPFLLKPLVGMVPSDAADHFFYNMDNNAASSNPSGTVTR